MTQTLLFARHGNTFAPGDKVVWVGRETDLPLVAKGREQAQALAASLRTLGWRPDAIYCAGLLRTRASAEIIATALDLPAPRVDHRLDELDYGGWAGRGNDEIRAEGHAAAMAAWNERDQWPERVGWGSDREEVMAGLRDFAADCLAPDKHHMPLVVSSNGILRFMPRLILAVAEQRSFKMATGHAGVVLRGTDGAADLAGWDLPPEELERIGVS